MRIVFVSASSFFRFLVLPVLTLQSGVGPAADKVNKTMYNIMKVEPRDERRRKQTEKNQNANHAKRKRKKKRTKTKTKLMLTRGAISVPARSGGHPAELRGDPAGGAGRLECRSSQPRHLGPGATRSPGFFPCAPAGLASVDALWFRPSCLSTPSPDVSLLPPRSDLSLPCRLSTSSTILATLWRLPFAAGCKPRTEKPSISPLLLHHTQECVFIAKITTVYTKKKRTQRCVALLLRLRRGFGCRRPGR